MVAEARQQPVALAVLRHRHPDQAAALPLGLILGPVRQGRADTDTSATVLRQDVRVGVPPGIHLRVGDERAVRLDADGLLAEG